jgi:hypothetical protein
MRKSLRAQGRTGMPPNAGIVDSLESAGPLSDYGDVISRTGTGEDPEAPTTGLAPLLILLQPAMLSTVTLMLPGSGGPGLGLTWLMNACIYPTTVSG